MSSHLIAAISQNLTPNFVATVASMLGIDRGTVEKALAAAIPSLLAGFAGLSAKPGGAQLLANAIASPAATPDEAAGSRAGSVADRGASQIASLLGGGTFSAVTGAVSKFTGLGDGATKTLFGLVSPVVLNTLGKEQRSAGLDANGLARMLSSEKSEIASAIPSGISGVLTELGFLESARDTARNASVRSAGESAAASSSAYVRQAETYGRQAETYGRSAAREAQSALPSWLLWGLLALAVVIGLMWYLMSGERTETSDAPVLAPREVTTPSVRTPAGFAQQVAQLGPSLSSLETSLRGVTDPASASAAIPTVQAMTSQLDRLGAVADQLPAGTREQLANLVREFKPRLDAVVLRLTTIPGVAGVLKPSLDALQAKVNALAV